MFDLGTAVGYLMLDASGFTSGFSNARASMNTFMDNTSSAQDRLMGLGSTMTSIGGTLTKSVTLPLVGVGTAAMKVGNDFEAQMSRVQAIAGATGTELEQLNDLALQLGADTSFSASQAAEGMENLASAGFTVNEIMDAMPGLLDLAASSGADLGRSTEIAAAAIRGFGLEASEAGHVADVFAEASARTNAQVEDMGEAMKYIAPVANAMGQSLEETAAAIGIMSDAGIKGSQAGTSLRGALSRLARPTDVMWAKMEELGLSFYDTEGNMLSLTGIVEQLEQGMEGLTQEQRNNALVTLFGQESLSGMLALIERGPEELSAMAKSFEEADGAAKEMADTMLDNTSGAIEAMMGSIETLGIKIQQVLAPVVQGVVEKITGFVNALSSMDESTLQIVVTIAGVVAALGPLLLIGGKILSFVATVGPMLSTAGIALSSLVAPIGIVIAATAALAAAWATNFGGIRDTVSSIMTSIQEIISTVLGTIMTLWNENFLGIQDIVSTVFGAIELIVSTVLDTIALVFDTFSKAFKGDWEGVWENVKTIFTGIWDAIGKLLSSFLNLLVDTLIRIGVSLLSAAKDAFGHIRQGFVDVWNGIVEWFEKAIDDPVGTVLGIGTALFDAGKSIFTSLWDGLKSVWDTITGWVEDCVDWIVSKVKFWEDESSKVNTGGDFSGSGSGRVSGSYASGLDYVPRDMNVRVHEGESIWTKNATRDFVNAMSTIMEGQPSGDLVVPVYVDGVEFYRATIHDFRRVSRENPEPA